MKRLPVALSLLCAVFFGQLANADPYSNWTYRMQIEFPGYDPPGGGQETLTNFPITGNSAVSHGGGLYCSSGGTINNSTLKND